MEASRAEMLGADPFEDPLEPDVIPHVPLLATPEERKALISELRGLIETDSYEIDPEVVAMAVMKDGRWVYG